jgi:hypothetical protein
MSETVTVTSSIVPQGTKLQNVRNGQYALPSLYIEVFEVVFGCLVVAFILGKQWKAVQSKKAAAQKAAPMEAPATAMETMGETA